MQEGNKFNIENQYNNLRKTTYVKRRNSKIFIPQSNKRKEKMVQNSNLQNTKALIESQINVMFDNNYIKLTPQEIQKLAYIIVNHICNP